MHGSSRGGRCVKSSRAVRTRFKMCSHLIRIRARCASRAGRRRHRRSRIIARRAVVTCGRREALLGAIRSVRARCTISLPCQMLLTACRTYIALFLIVVDLVSNWTIKTAGRTFVACKLSVSASFAMAFRRSWFNKRVGGTSKVRQLYVVGVPDISRGYCTRTERDAFVF